MNNPKISIVVPVYNVPHNMLIKCLDSLIHQTYKNNEIIIVDDGSPDIECSKICDNYKIYKNVKIYHKKNGGLCDARNYGVKKCTGKWVTFVDGDDYLSNDCLEKVNKKIMIDKKIDIVCFGTIKEYKTTSFKYNYNNIFVEKKVYDDKYELLKKLLDFNSNIGDVTSKFYKKDFLINNYIEHDKDIRQGVEAIDFNFRCFEKCNGLQFVSIFGYNYAYNEKSITSSISYKSIELLIEGIKKLYSDVNSCSHKDLLLNLLDERVKFVIVTTIISGIFSPNNKINFKDKKREAEYFLNNDYINRSLNSKSISLDFKRKIIIKLIKHKFYLSISIIAKLRYYQKERF